ncbi:MAG TPA: hypothetical protein V6D14_15180 [Coleofasciculaceae cyanobacterium]|jgi:hypothetical protein
MAWNPGQTLQGGKYTLEGELGRGRFDFPLLIFNPANNQLPQ